MADIFGWLLTFFFLVSLLAIVSFQLICFADLEFDYMNIYDSAARINMVVMPEFVLQALFCLVCLTTRHDFLLSLSLPNLYYNLRLYTNKRHLVDVTEIINHLSWEKKQRLIKLFYIVLLIIFFLFWSLWTLRSDD